MGFFDLFKRTPASATPHKLSAPADVRGAPGTRIYHEYGVAEQPVNGRYGWTCVVYAADNTPHRMTGSSETDLEARVAAINWASSKKAELRGVA